MDSLQNMLARLAYTPNQGLQETKQLRERYAGNPEMQRRLAVDDRFHQGKGIMQDSPAAALAALAGSIPYDAAKLAYFSGPAPVKKTLGSLTERMFPGEGFNDQTTSWPDLNQYRGMVSGMLQGWGR